MSPEAVTARLRQVSELREVCLSFRQAGKYPVHHDAVLEVRETGEETHENIFKR